MWSRGSIASGICASLILHGAWLLGLRSAQLPQPSAARAPSPSYTLPFEASFSAGPATAAAAAIAPGGPNTQSALDLDAASGRGGVPSSEQRALLLFSFVSPLTLQDTDLNNLRQNQMQRIATAAARASAETRRATPHAALAVFLASGERGHRERREPARRDARAGSETGAGVPARAALPGAASSAAASEGAVAPAAAAQPGDASERRGGATGERAESPRGIARGRGERAQHAARVAFARPNVDLGPAATPAEQRDGRLRDNLDAELLAAALQRSIVDASAQRALQRAAGSGGGGEGPGLSEHGAGQGARARPYSPGPGRDRALDTEDARYVRWFVEQKERVQNELVFPQPRALALDQGVSVYRVVVRRDGRLAGAPSLVRSSGFADFDRAAVAAIRRALPFSPLPDQLVPGARDLSLLIPVAFSNPLVQ